MLYQVGDQEDLTEIYLILHISCSDEIWHSYTLKDSKNIWITWHPLEFCWHQHFFTGNQKVLLYQEIEI